MFLMQADTLRGQVGGGWALEIESFFKPCEMASSRKASAIWGSKNSRDAPVHKPSIQHGLINIAYRY